MIKKIKDNIFLVTFILIIIISFTIFIIYFYNDNNNNKQLLENTLKSTKLDFVDWNPTVTTKSWEITISENKLPYNKFNNK